MPARLTELRLTEFKTFRNAVLPMGDMTVLIGRNSSGKSNALDALEVLSRLAEGGHIVDALDSRRGDEGPLRGGIEGCPPHGSEVFTLGCTVLNPDRATEDGYTAVDLDLTIRLGPDPDVIRETMSGWRGTSDQPKLGSPTSLFDRTHARWSDLPLSSLMIPRLRFSVSASMLPRHAKPAADDLLNALRRVFHLDPVPHLMRQYVPGRDIRLRRTAENLSAVIHHMRQSAPESFDELVWHTQALVEHEISTIDLVSSTLGDVMLALQEGTSSTPAREMSDGLLRYMAIATTLLHEGENLDLSSADSTSPTLVIEELENGLHPSQASQLLDLVKATTGAQVIFTTHSPALLSALAPEDHANVIVSTRDRATGLSHLTNLPDIEGYPSLMAQGDLGAVVTAGKLERRTPELDHTEFDRLMGLGQQ
ncbi:AAA family ATPase [Nonomuraea sp. NPDC050404]|uniref:AAA family ATPase n=1 Tax=Nonomuraea sp. NPDC050404 TaxID=3155783 RepID=UPI0033E8B36D